MAFIDKLLNKFNKAKQAINSLKGIQSKIQSINYTTAINALGEEKKAAETLLEARRDTLSKGLGSGKVGDNYSKEAPKVNGYELVYPRYDALDNYIVFVARPRRDRKGNSEHPVFKRNQAALYVPDAIISQATVTYQAEAPNKMARALEQVAKGFEKGFWDGMGALGEQSNKNAHKFISQQINNLSGGFSNLREGRAINPMMEQMLQGVPFRSWDFTFDFWPKSVEEAMNVNRIIYMFRSSMLPDTYSGMMKFKWDGTPFDLIGGEDDTDVVSIDEKKKFVETNASFFNYPNVFDIFFEGPMASRVDGFLPAVCTNAQVDYTGGQKFSTFADGQPVHIQLTLNFLEIKTLNLGNYETIRNPSAWKELRTEQNEMSVGDRFKPAGWDPKARNPDEKTDETPDDNTGG